MTQEQEWRENEGEPMARLEEERLRHMDGVRDRKPTEYTHAEALAKAAALRFRAFDLQGGGL